MISKQFRIFPRPADLFSPAGFLTRAALLIAGFLLAHLLGLREFTTALSGTYAWTGPLARFSSMLGLLYVFLYLGAVVLAPILLIAAALRALHRSTPNPSREPRRRPSSPTPPADRCPPPAPPCRTAPSGLPPPSGENAPLNHVV